MTTITPINPHHIHAAGAQDRLDSDAMEDARLAASIRDHGQQVPILVRPDPGRPGHYDIVYGRRRTFACRDLGLAVHAIVAPLDDTALLMAQGQENTARRNLSFAEKAHFARQLAAAGYDRPFICAALSTTLPDLSRMTTLTTRIPAALMEAIGAAPAVGRDRWMHLAGLLPHDAITTADLTALITLADAPTSDARFQYALDVLLASRRNHRAARQQITTRPLLTADGLILGHARYVARRTDLSFATRQVDIRLDPRRCDGFDDWLIMNVARLHACWLAEMLQPTP